ncbi:MAG: hypothetical protein ACTSV2_10425 [Candidatus Thorarchaeota archaeon]
MQNLSDILQIVSLGATILLLGLLALTLLRLRTLRETSDKLVAQIEEGSEL